MFMGKLIKDRYIYYQLKLKKNTAEDILFKSIFKLPSNKWNYMW